MCGIAGIVDLSGTRPPTVRQIKAMSDTLVHRGPDDVGFAVKGAVGLGMRRLSIIDIQGGHQPIYNEDRTISAVFNGEIYNFRSLRRNLVAKGHRFATASDTEVIVHLYEEVGLEFPEQLNGMFAIALYDEVARRVVLVRDHLGIKPLFIAQTNDSFVFGSEVKALLASGRVDRHLDVDALGQFLAWEYVPAPATLFKQIRKVEAGSFVEIAINEGMVRHRKYWDVPLHNDDLCNGAARRDSDWVDAVDEKLAECVRRQLISDVPLGAFLSGGVDSSLIVAAMGDATTFSIGFDDPSYDETPWSQHVAGQLGVNHFVEVIRPDVVQLFADLMHVMDDPIADFSIFPTYLVSQLARKKVKVALSGDGGDELFGGYETYLAQSRAQRWMQIPRVIRQRVLEPAIGSMRPRKAKKGLINKARRFVEGLEHSPRLGHARWRVFAGEAVRDALVTKDARRGMPTPVDAHVAKLLDAAGSLNETDRALYADIRSYLVDNCLVKVDRMSMACSLETRVPILDRELVELAFQVPAHLKYGFGQTKVLLKRVALRHVPCSCVQRPKQGFSIPMKQWLRTSFRPLIDRLLAPSRLQEAGLFEPAYVKRLVSDHLSNRANHSHLLWALLVFEDWRERWGVAA